MLPLRYDAESRSGFIRLREGKVVRTERLSAQAVAEYGRHGQLLTMALTELDPTAAEFLRTADEETLLAVIERQGGRRAPPARPPRPPRPPRRRRR
jgi:hypothetical protein